MSRGSGAYSSYLPTEHACTPWREMLFVAPAGTAGATQPSSQPKDHRPSHGLTQRPTSVGQRKQLGCLEADVPEGGATDLVAGCQRFRRPSSQAPPWLRWVIIKHDPSLWGFGQRWHGPTSPTRAPAAPWRAKDAARGRWKATQVRMHPGGLSDSAGWSHDMCFISSPCANSISSSSMQKSFTEIRAVEEIAIWGQLILDRLDKTGRLYVEMIYEAITLNKK